jgi:uncharacterized integral membrane protein
MKKAKVIAIIVISILILIIFWQNKGNVEARLLLATITMPLVLLLILVFLLGFVGGLITASHVLRRPKKAQAEQQKK